MENEEVTGSNSSENSGLGEDDRELISEYKSSLEYQLGSKRLKQDEIVDDDLKDEILEHMFDEEPHISLKDEDVIKSSDLEDEFIQQDEKDLDDFIEDYEHLEYQPDLVDFSSKYSYNSPLNHELFELFDDFKDYIKVMLHSNAKKHKESKVQRYRDDISSKYETDKIDSKNFDEFQSYEWPYSLLFLKKIYKSDNSKITLPSTEFIIQYMIKYSTNYNTFIHKPSEFLIGLISKVVSLIIEQRFDIPFIAMYKEHEITYLAQNVIKDANDTSHKQPYFSDFWVIYDAVYTWAQIILKVKPFNLNHADVHFECILSTSLGLHDFFGQLKEICSQVLIQKQTPLISNDYAHFFCEHTKRIDNVLDRSIEWNFEIIKQLFYNPLVCLHLFKKFSEIIDQVELSIEISISKIGLNCISNINTLNEDTSIIPYHLLVWLRNLLKSSTKTTESVFIISSNHFSEKKLDWLYLQKNYSLSILNYRLIFNTKNEEEAITLQFFQYIMEVLVRLTNNALALNDSITIREILSDLISSILMPFYSKQYFNIKFERSRKFLGNMIQQRMQSLATCKPLDFTNDKRYLLLQIVNSNNTQENSSLKTLSISWILVAQNQNIFKSFDIHKGFINIGFDGKIIDANGDYSNEIDNGINIRHFITTILKASFIYLVPPKKSIFFYIDPQLAFTILHRILAKHKIEILWINPCAILEKIDDKFDIFNHCIQLLINPLFGYNSLNDNLLVTLNIHPDQSFLSENERLFFLHRALTNVTSIVGINLNLLAQFIICYVNLIDPKISCNDMKDDFEQHSSVGELEDKDENNYSKPRQRILYHLLSGSYSQQITKIMCQILSYIPGLSTRILQNSIPETKHCFFNGYKIIHSIILSHSRISFINSQTVPNPILNNFIPYIFYEDSFEPLDKTRIHPYDYDLARKVASEFFGIINYDISKDTCISIAHDNSEDENKLDIKSNMQIGRSITNWTLSLSSESTFKLLWENFNTKFQQAMNSLQLENLIRELFVNLENLRNNTNMDPTLSTSKNKWDKTPLGANDQFALFTHKSETAFNFYFESDYDELLNEDAVVSIIRLNDFMLLIPPKMKKRFIDIIRNLHTTHKPNFHLLNNIPFLLPATFISSVDRKSEIIQAKITKLDRERWVLFVEPLYSSEEKLVKIDKMRSKNIEPSFNLTSIVHPLFRTKVGRSEAESILQNDSVGSVIFRQSKSLGINHIALTCKIGEIKNPVKNIESIFQHIDIKLLAKIDALSPLYRIDLLDSKSTNAPHELAQFSYSFHSLDEIVGRYIEPVITYFNEATKCHKWYEKGTAESPNLYEYLISQSKLFPDRIAYCLAFSKFNSGTIAICYLSRSSSLSTVKYEEIKVIPTGYIFYRKLFPRIELLINWFKSNFDMKK